MKNQKTSISIRALSADNNRHIRDLIGLFERNYQSDYPIKSVYQREFWRSHIAGRFISLACFHEGEILAHLACQPDKHNPSVLQIAYTALDSRAQEFAPIIGSLMWQTIRRLARRQKWHLIYHLDILPSPSAHFFQDILGTYETLICPGYYASASSNRAIKRPSLLVSQRFVEREFSSNGEQLPKIELFVPERHVDICHLLYAPLQLPRTFACESKNAVTKNKNQNIFPEDARAIEHAYYPEHALTHITIQPSMVTKDYMRSLRHAQAKSKTTLLCLSMRDHACAPMCEELEDYGYRFSGIAAGYQGRDNIVYTKTDEVHIDVNQFTCERARKLATYIESYGSSKNTSTLLQPFAAFSHSYVGEKAF